MFGAGVPAGGVSHTGAGSSAATRWRHRSAVAFSIRRNKPPETRTIRTRRKGDSICNDLHIALGFRAVAARLRHSFWPEATESLTPQKAFSIQQLWKQKCSKQLCN